MASCEVAMVGKVVFFGGDFRHILPVVPKGSRQDIVYASLSSSRLIWSHCQILKLTKNMRLQVRILNIFKLGSFLVCFVLVLKVLNIPRPFYAD